MSERPIPISVEESAELIRAASDGRVLQLALGGGLIVCDSNRWALRLVYEWREDAKGRTMADGAGI